MKKYEVACVIEPDETILEECKVAITKRFEELKIEVLDTLDMGVRPTSYPLKKFNSAHYVVYTLNSPPDVISSLRSYLLLVKNLLRFLIIIKDEKKETKVQNKDGE